MKQQPFSKAVWGFRIPFRKCAIFGSDQVRPPSALTTQCFFGNRNFGRITSQQNDPRSVQFALRLVF